MLYMSISLFWKQLFLTLLCKYYDIVLHTVGLLSHLPICFQWHNMDLFESAKVVFHGLLQLKFPSSFSVLSNIYYFVGNISHSFSLLSFFKDFIYLFLETGERKDKERERNISVWLPFICPLLETWPSTQAWALDWESNQRPFGLQASTQSTEPHQPGPFSLHRINGIVMLNLLDRPSVFPMFHLVFLIT